MSDIPVDFDQDEITIHGVTYRRETPPADPHAGSTPLVPGEDRQTDERGALATGANPHVELPPQDPRDVALLEFNKRMADGRSREDASTVFWDHLIGAAVKGDERVIYNPDRDRDSASAYRPPIIPESAYHRTFDGT